MSSADAVADGKASSCRSPAACESHTTPAGPESAAVLPTLADPAGSGAAPECPGSRTIAAAASRRERPQMRVGISGTHGTGKTTLAQALCARLPGHVTADEPYYLLEEEGYEFGFPPSLEDYQALLACSVQSLTAPPQLPGVIFDRTPLDYLAYLAAAGADPSDEADAAALRPVIASLDLLVITVITPETEQVLPTAEMPGLRSQMNDALLELLYDDPLIAWGDVPVLELNGPLDDRPNAVLAALNQSRHPRPPGPNARSSPIAPLALIQHASQIGTRGRNQDVSGLCCSTSRDEVCWDTKRRSLCSWSPGACFVFSSEADHTACSTSGVGATRVTAQLAPRTASSFIGSGAPIRSLCAQRSTGFADERMVVGCPRGW